MRPYWNCSKKHGNVFFHVTRMRDNKKKIAWVDIREPGPWLQPFRCRPDGKGSYIERALHVPGFNTYKRHMTHPGAIAIAHSLCCGAAKICASTQTKQLTFGW